MRSLPNILPSVKFPNFGNVSCFSYFSRFSWKKRGKFGKKLLDKTGPNKPRTNIPENYHTNYYMFPHLRNSTGGERLAQKVLPLPRDDRKRYTGKTEPVCTVSVFQPRPVFFKSHNLNCCAGEGNGTPFNGFCGIGCGHPRTFRRT